MPKEHADFECSASLLPTQKSHYTYPVLYTRNEFDVKRYTPVEIKGLGVLAEGLNI